MTAHQAPIRILLLQQPLKKQFFAPASTMTLARTLTLSSGKPMPVFGLGTWKAEKNEVAKALKIALEAGYKHIDGALVYQNEAEIGEVYKSWFASHPREDVFITSKLWNTYHRPENVTRGIDKTLKDLQLNYLDLYLMHWPVAFEPSKENPGNMAKDSNGNPKFEDVSIQETWQAMEKLIEQGKTKHIGVSNFNIATLKHLLTCAKIKPAVNQVELHPYLPQQELVDFCHEHNIVVTAYSPLGSGGEPNLLEDPVIKELAKKYNTSAGQICISWAIQRNTVVIPKSTNPDRIRSNQQHVSIDQADMTKLTALGQQKPKRFIRSKDFWGVDVYDESKPRL